MEKAAEMIRCTTILNSGEWRAARDLCVLQYDDRFVRRKVIATAQNYEFLLDLPQTVSLSYGDAFQLENGEIIAVIEAEEPLLEITAADLTLLAWHIGNRHTPCQIEIHRRLIQRDPVIRKMLESLGATVVEIMEPFTPEGDAYGHGRTLSHAH